MLSLHLLLYWCGAAVAAANMNGKPGQYKIANSETFVTDYHQECFDVYSHKIKSQYSQVHWRYHDNISLPTEIVKRFNGKTMAIVGYEVDQVMLNDQGEEVPVPITWAYNHHYGAMLRNSEIVKVVKKRVTSPEQRKSMGMNHGSEHYLDFELINDDGVDNSTVVIPNAQIFSSGNGGEMRMSYHGYPKGYAQLIQSPDMFSITPMQIDTWNREMTDAKYIPGGPLPRSSQIPTTTAGYNGLLECPCSDRLPKDWGMSYQLTHDGACLPVDGNKETKSVHNASECFAGARAVIHSDKYIDETKTDAYSGCTALVKADGSAVVTWNGAGAPSLQQNQVKIALATMDGVKATVSLRDDVVEMKLVGPADAWFGIGFGTDSMCVHFQGDECPGGGPYAIVVADQITERRLGFHGPGSILDSSVSVESNEVHENKRTVVLRRSLKGASQNHYTFDPSVSTVPVILAKGCGLEFAQHCGHSSSSLNFLPVNTVMHVCQAGIAGTIGGNRFQKNRCAPFPTGDLLWQKNPTCDIQTYRGGLSCCRDGHLLLDNDQEAWPGNYLEYRLKFRFYFEEYEPAAVSPETGLMLSPPSHQNIIRVYWQTEATAAEYDIPPCRKGVPPSQCVHVITSRWKVTDMMADCSLHTGAGCAGEGSTDPRKTQGIKLIYAAPHCHAPTCLSMELYNADTGQLICHVEPIHGQSDTEIYDERGYLAIPPCLWSDNDASEGLVAPELLLLNATLLSIKRNNNTLPHTGAMAPWQMRALVVPVAENEIASGRRPTERSNLRQTDGRRDSDKHGK